MSKLYFHYGAMNSGKTTALLQVAHNYEEKGMKIILIKPKTDTKGLNKVVSRLGVEREVDKLNTIEAMADFEYIFVTDFKEKDEDLIKNFKANYAKVVILKEK